MVTTSRPNLDSGRVKAWEVTLPQDLGENPRYYRCPHYRAALLCKRVYRIKISNVNELKPHVNREWVALRHAVIERAVGEWRQRLRACVRPGGTCCNKDDIM